MKKILFVCTGNTCRSSMAEALFRNMIESAGNKISGIKVESAGICAIPGQPASQQAVFALKDEGIDLSYHKSKPLTKQMIKEADLILTMTVNHKNAVLQMAPEARNKVYTLKEYAHGDIDIDSILDQLNDLYKKVNEKRERLIRERKREIKALEKRRDELIKELFKIEQEIKDWEIEIEAELEDDKAQIRKLEQKIPSLDIEDPFGQPVEVYKETAQGIKELLQKVIDRVMGEK